MERGNSYASGGSCDQRGLAGLNFRGAMNHLPGGAEVQDDGRGVTIRDGVGDGEKLGGIADENFRESAMDRECGDALPQFERSDTRADGVDHAGDFVSRHEGHLRRIEILARQHVQVS